MALKSTEPLDQLRDKPALTSNELSILLTSFTYHGMSCALSLLQIGQQFPVSEETRFGEDRMVAFWPTTGVEYFTKVTHYALALSNLYHRPLFVYLLRLKSETNQERKLLRFSRLISFFIQGLGPERAV